MYLSIKDYSKQLELIKSKTTTHGLILQDLENCNYGRNYYLVPPSFDNNIEKIKKELNKSTPNYNNLIPYFQELESIKKTELIKINQEPIEFPIEGKNEIWIQFGIICFLLVICLIILYNINTEKITNLTSFSIFIVFFVLFNLYFIYAISVYRKENFKRNALKILMFVHKHNHFDTKQKDKLLSVILNELSSTNNDYIHDGGFLKFQKTKK